MLFSASALDYPEGERSLRVHHRFTIPFLCLYNQEGTPLQDIRTFDTSSMTCTMKDGSIIQVQRYGWVCSTQSSFEMVLRCLPEDQHFIFIPGAATPSFRWGRRSLQRFDQ
jgi:hypothetical protein